LQHQESPKPLADNVNRTIHRRSDIGKTAWSCQQDRLLAVRCPDSRPVSHPRRAGGCGPDSDLADPAVQGIGSVGALGRDSRGKPPDLARATAGQQPPVTVRSLQYLLNAHGAGLVVDGIFGPRTSTAVRELQRAHGLVVDGIVGPRTWSAVIVTVRRGSVGPAVKAVQDQANSRIGASGTTSHGLVVDGIFGPRTDDWVNDFQSAIAGHVLDYPVDGIVGPLTWSLLITGEKPQPLQS
jgi:peptidoglycan hydrolase-like protein with peptidoglycan-binding domain